MGNPPFGHFALSPWREAMRRMAGNPYQGRVGRILTSGARRIAQFAHPDPFDVEIFQGQRARLYPRDNLCEKRVFARPDSWDHEERLRISQIIKSYNNDRPFRFIDAGANVGMYTLFVLGEANTAAHGVRVLAIEPDPENRQRLSFNLQASRALDQVTIVDKALGSKEGRGHLIFPGDNRGEIRLATKEEQASLPDRKAAQHSPHIEGARANSSVKIAITSLATLLEKESIDHVDMLKIDIEGGEAAVFKSFFSTAQRSQFPRWIIIETISQTGEAALEACITAGYDVDLQTPMNAVLKLQKKQDDR